MVRVSKGLRRSLETYSILKCLVPSVGNLKLSIIPNKASAKGKDTITFKLYDSSFEKQDCIIDDGLIQEDAIPPRDIYLESKLMSRNKWAMLQAENV